LTVVTPANQPPSVSLTAPANGASYAAPATIPLTASAADADGTVSRVEFYNGATLLGTDTTSPFGYNWSNVTAGTYSLSAVAYDAAGGKATSAARTVTVTDATLGVPAPWTAADVGSPALAGSATYANGVFSVSAAGTDIWNTADQFHFVYQPVAGDVDIVARVDSLTVVDPYTNAGVMIRSTLTSGSLHGYTAETGSNGVYFRRRLANGSTTISNQAAVVSAPVWVRLVRKGALVTSYWSNDGNNWTTIGSETMTLGTTAYVGLATSSHNASTRTAARFSNVRVTQPTQNPSVSITSPASGTSYTAPASVAIAASASDPEGRMSAVEFYAGSTLIARDTAAPYAASWTASTAGTYALTAVALDADGGRTTSTAVNVTIVGPNQPPTVTLTSPANNSSFTAPATLAMAATAADPENALARVEFYAGTTLLATDTTAPFAYSWGSVPAGTYTLRAVAYDTAGASASSAANTVTVGSATTSPPRAVVFQASADHATLVTRYELRIFASGANPLTSTPLATSDLGKPAPATTGDITVDRATFFSGLAVGNYVAAVSAIGAGGTSTSTAVAFTR
jgi:regulation of enolase protein 1 (concanavalin A-like superfamily)